MPKGRTDFQRIRQGLARRLRRVDRLRAPKPVQPGRKKLFVVGSGRSGTHFLGYILEPHPQVYATIEDPDIFDDVTAMALDPAREPELYPKLEDFYRREHGRHGDRHYLDKSHPNLWIAERLADSFPEAVFLGIQREPYGTVASMLKHAGVLVWHERWREFPVPNRFLGIGEREAETYDELPLAAKCALRWRAHEARMRELQQRLGDRIWVGSYEELLTDTRSQIDDLERFLGLEQPIPDPELRRESLDKWRTQLSEQDIEAVASVVGAAPAPR
jgi:hypothetical protein